MLTVQDHEHSSTCCQHSTTAGDDCSASPTSKSTFKTPRKKILTPNDLKKFQESETYSELLAFVLALNDAVRNKPLPVETAGTRESTTACTSIPTSVSRVINILYDLVSQHPPTDQSSRFGNTAFRDYFDAVQAALPNLLHEHLSHSGLTQDAIQEIHHYLLHSFGNRQRIDYGTGHELNFLCFLLCLDKLQIIKQHDHQDLVLVTFTQYLRWMRKLQETYWLEPAGSHGVWGLDDYHFLPFLFGSGQLVDHPYLRPRSIHTIDLTDHLDKYLYFQCIHSIITTKSCPGLSSSTNTPTAIHSQSLRWHSPMLDDISAVKTWSKVNSGMVKMYKAEVLGKLPIMQHFLFGSLIKAEWEAESSFPEEQEGHVHVHAFGQERPTCCNMRLPSTFAAPSAGVGFVTAKGEAHKGVGNVAETGSLRGGRARMIPFD